LFCVITFEQVHVFLSGTRCSPSPADTSAWCLVLHYLYHGVLTGCLSREQTGENLIVLGQDFRVHVVPWSIQILL